MKGLLNSKHTTHLGDSQVKLFEIPVEMHKETPVFYEVPVELEPLEQPKERVIREIVEVEKIVEKYVKVPKFVNIQEHIEVEPLV